MGGKVSTGKARTVATVHSCPSKSIERLYRKSVQDSRGLFQFSRNAPSQPDTRYGIPPVLWTCVQSSEQRRSLSHPLPLHEDNSGGTSAPACGQAYPTRWDLLKSKHAQPLRSVKSAASQGRCRRHESQACASVEAGQGVISAVISANPLPSFAPSTQVCFKVHRLNS